MMNYRQAIETYYDCFRTRDLERLRALLTEDFRHVSPYGDWSDRDAMLDAIWPSVTGETFATSLEVFGDGGRFLVRYEHAGKSTARIAEYIRFDGERIAEIEVYLGANATPRPDR